MPRRSDARKVALQMLYLVDVNPDVSLQQIHQLIKHELSDAELVEFAENIVSGVRDHQP